MTITDDHNTAKSNATIYPYPLLSAVTNIYELYTRADIKILDRARRYQGLLD